MAATIVDGNANSVTSTPVTTAVAGGAKLRLMCSYGGQIVPRRHDRSLCYIGGETRVVGVDRRVTLAELSDILSRLVGADTGAFSIKYRLPYEDLDSLVSVATEDDLDVMLEEYDRIAAAKATATKPSRRLRLFLFPSNTVTDAEDNGGGGCRRELSVDDLLGLDVSKPIPSSSTATKMRTAGDGQEENSSPNSPLLGTPSSSSSSSSSSSGSFVQSVNGCGLDEQSAQAAISGHKQDEGLRNAVMTTTMCSTKIPSQNSGVVSSDDENRTSPKGIHMDSSGQASKMQTSEQCQYVYTNPNGIQFQQHQTTSTPMIPLQSYYPQQPLLQAQTHLYNPQMPVYFLPTQPNTLPVQHYHSSDAATMIHPPDNPSIPLPSPALLSRGISLPSQKHESTITTGNQSTQVGHSADQNQQNMSFYHQVPQYISQPLSTANYSYHPHAVAGPLPPQYLNMNSEAITKSISNPPTMLQQPRSSS